MELQKGNFEWEDEQKSRVIFVPCNDGRFTLNSELNLIHYGLDGSGITFAIDPYKQQQHGKEI